MQAAPLVDIDTTARDQAGPCLEADLLDACSEETAPVGAEGRRLLRLVVNLLRRAPRTGASYYDPLFASPDTVENDYYRLSRQIRA